MADENRTATSEDKEADTRREKADEAAQSPGPSDKQGGTAKPDPVEQQPT